MEETFARLRDLMLANAPDMVVAGDSPGDLVLHAPWSNPRKPKEAMWFGGVMLKKNYVSFHLMPVYSEAALAAAVPDLLRKRMQGKSCFNFKTLDNEQAVALAALTESAAKAYATPIGG